MKKMADIEYAYASSLIRASGEKGTAAMRLERIRDCRSIDELCSAAADMFRVSGGNDIGVILDAALAEAAYCLKDAVPDASLYAPLFYKYDCCNIKTVLKCDIRGLDVGDSLYPFGTVSADDVKTAVREHTAGVLPSAMERALGEARRSYAAGDAAAIDLILDRACFEDMSSGAALGGEAFMIRAVRDRADMTNLLTSLRISKMGLESAAAASLMRRAFVPGGSIGISEFVTSDDVPVKTEIAAGSAANDRLSAALKAAVQGNGRKAADAATTEKMLDEALLASASDVKYIPFGFEVPAAFFIIREAEVKNCRLAAAGLASRETGSERMRETYV
jgi:V/A-type H+-transporting ATPase subunit C